MKSNNKIIKFKLREEEKADPLDGGGESTLGDRCEHGLVTVRERKELLLVNKENKKIKKERRGRK